MAVNGLTVIDDRRLRRGGSDLRVSPSERAFISINNLLAATPIKAVAAGAVRALLEEQGVDGAELRPRFRTLYAHVLGQFVLDLELTELEEADLLHLKDLLGLTRGDVELVFRAVVQGSYEQLALRAEAGQLPGGGIARLRDLATALKIPEPVADRVLGGL